MASLTFRGCSIPDRMMPPLMRWVSEGVVPGDFLQAVLRNDLQGAINRADPENLANLPAFTGWLYAEAPSQCWGSTEKVKAWAEKHRVCDAGATSGDDVAAARCM